MENEKNFECPYFPMEDLPRIKELWKEKLETMGIDTEEVDMDYLSTNFNDDFAVYCNFDEKTINSFDFEQPDDEIERLIKRRYLKKDPFILKFPQKEWGDFKRTSSDDKFMRIDRSTLIGELAAHGMEICGDPANYIDRGSCIELVKPIGRIKMIEKIGSWKALSSEESRKYAKGLSLGGFKDWRIPEMPELLAIYAVKDICGIRKYKSSFYDFWWSDSRSIPWSVAFSNGLLRCSWNESCFVRCVRYA